MSRPHRSRGLLVFIALLLAGGAIVNVAVAWGCAMWIDLAGAVPVWGAEGRPNTREMMAFARTEKTGVVQHFAAWGCSLSDDPTQEIRDRGSMRASRQFAMNRITMSLALGDRQGSVASWDEAHLPVWGSISHWIAQLRLRKASQSVEFDSDARILDGRGWPAIAMWCAAMPNPNGGWQPAEFGNAIVLTPWTSRRYAYLSDERALPLGIVWPGFAINTVFYAANLWGGWLLFVAPFAIRRRRRIKRGLCPVCAYPVGSSDVCTECGKPVKP